jgi:hypothetical protein
MKTARFTISSSLMIRRGWDLFASLSRHWCQLIPNDLRNPLKELWLAFKIVLTVAIMANALILIVPREEELREATAVLPYVTATVADMARRLGIFGALNVAMALIAAFLGVFKPGPGGRSSNSAD